MQALMMWGRIILCGFLSLASFGQADEMPPAIRSFLSTYCLDCHGGEKVKGDVDFSLIRTQADMDAHFELWETAASLLQDNEMPPEDSKQPDLESRQQFQDWYQMRFVESVKAHPGHFRPRRLSAVEYRNTLRSVFGFDLEVQIIEAEQTVVERFLVLKLLPTDPPGQSGFTNDTHGNPLTTLIWNQYSYLVDQAIHQLFSEKQKKALEAMAGEAVSGGMELPVVERVFNRFMKRVYRRPLKETDFIERMDIIRNSQDLELALKTEMKAALMSPAFLYRGFLMQPEPGIQQAVDAFEYAERMSYFLWGDMPDEALIQIAADGTLMEPLVMRQQLDRMLASPKSRHLAESLGWQWFGLDGMEQATRQVPVLVALQNQVLDYVHYLFIEDRPLMELIDSDVSFVNPLIAKHYPKDRHQLERYRKQKGIELEIVPNQMIKLEHTKERGGLLTMPGILAMNRGPVLRGTWMLERILGEHLPEPPMDVGEIPPSQPGQKLTFRERFEAHRNQASCSICHDKIDPLGFAAQGYDHQGSYILRNEEIITDGEVRYKSKDGEWVDTSGKLPNGTRFSNFGQLKQILKTEYRTQIIRNIVKRTLSFALCRSLKLHDRPTVESLTSRLEETNGTFHDLLVSIVGSLPFRETFVKADTL